MYSMLRVYYSACKYIGLYTNGSGLLFHYLSIEKKSRFKKYNNTLYRNKNSSQM